MTDERGKPEDPATEKREARRRRLAEVFGDVLPEQTSDDATEPADSESADEWLRRQVPPHHG